MIIIQNPKISVSNSSTTISVTKVDLIVTLGTNLFALNVRCFDATGKPVMVDHSLISPMTADEKTAAANYQSVEGDTLQQSLEKACAGYIGRVFGV